MRVNVDASIEAAPGHVIVSRKIYCMVVAEYDGAGAAAIVATVVANDPMCPVRADLFALGGAALGCRVLIHAPLQLSGIYDAALHLFPQASARKVAELASA